MFIYMERERERAREGEKISGLKEALSSCIYVCMSMCIYVCVYELPSHNQYNPAKFKKCLINHDCIYFIRTATLTRS